MFNERRSNSFIFILIIILSVLSATSTAKADLIGSMDFNLGTLAGANVIYNSIQLEIYHGPFLGSGARLFDLILSESDVGNTYTVSSGTDFDDAVAMLTNGIDDEFNATFFIIPFTGTGWGLEGTESCFLLFSDSSDPSRVDFSGYNINSMSFTLNSITFDTPGRDLNENGIWTDFDIAGSVTFDGTVVPVPGSVLLGVLGLTAAGVKLRKYA